MSFDLTGYAALVTGAGSAQGIGFATAMALGRLGARVFITSTTDRCVLRASELAAAGIEARARPADLVRLTDIDDLVQDALDAYGHIDILVNNAGMTSVGDPIPASAPTHAVTAAAWAHTMERNLTSVFRLSARVLPGMMARRWGRIVSVASTTGTTGAMVGEAPYAAAKAGIVGLTRTMAVEYARHGITANAVAPGWIATASQTPHEAEQGQSTPAGRSGTPAEVACVIAALCAPGASYITGQCLTIDGGNSIAEERAPATPRGPSTGA